MVKVRSLFQTQACTVLPQKKREREKQKAKGGGWGSGADSLIIRGGWEGGGIIYIFKLHR